MKAVQIQPGEVNVLASEASWAWPKAMQDIFRPRGVNMLMAKNANEFVDVIEHERIHTTIIDMDSACSGLVTVKIIRKRFPVMPCILLASRIEKRMLDKALRLNVFGVVDKPVDMDILQGLLNRMFIKKYGSHIFE